MDRETEQPDALIALGAASETTLGAKGELSDFVREMPQAGLTDD